MLLPRLNILLLKPSKYDDDGYVIHHMRGVLPSNTLYALNGLFHSAAKSLKLSVRFKLIDETVELIEPTRILPSFSNANIPTLVCLVGVQTNQFVRATDLARQFRELGVMVVMGGFHISGTVSVLGITRELSALTDIGVSLFVGEAEGRVESLLQDAVSGILKKVYQIQGYPQLSQRWPLPKVDSKISKRFALPFAGTVDTSRGCIFHCSFCTVIQVQGNTMRSRDPQLIEEHIRLNYPNFKYYFFTDDNMARNRNWRELFERLIRMRREGVHLKFMMQVDTAAHKIPGFVDLAARAGCSQVFLGIESLNTKNLEAASKLQNKVERFEEMSCTWHRKGIAVHAAYIIGFPHDCPASVENDFETLVRTVQPDQASFFMLTPLPGSIDHRKLVEQGTSISSDFNNFDSFHAVTDHPLMERKTWRALYERSWSSFYSKENLIHILRRIPPKLYWDVLKNAAWYR